MNKIHKVIWSRCAHAFVVVSELASSSSGKKSTSTTVGMKPSIRHRLGVLTACTLLALGVCQSAIAQVTVTYGAPDQDGLTENISSWDDALTIEGSGTGDILIKNSSFSLVPAAPRSDTNPYAGIRVQNGSGTDDRAQLENSAIIVEGENLHGVYLEGNTFMRAIDSTVSATGKNVTGFYIESSPTSASLQLTGGLTEVSGTDAKGIYVGSGLASFDGNSTIRAQGNRAIGIDVDGGSISASDAQTALSVEVIGYAGSDATGIRFNSGEERELKGINVTVTGAQDGATTTGILVKDLTLDAGQRRLTLGGGTSAAERVNITVNGGTHSDSITTGIELLAANLQASIRNTTLQVDTVAGLAGINSRGIVLKGDASALAISDTSIAVGNDDSVGSVGLAMLASSQGDANSVTITGTSTFEMKGEEAIAIQAAKGQLDLTDTQITLHGGQSVGLDLNQTTANITNNSLILNGFESTGLVAAGSESQIYVNDSTITGSANRLSGIQATDAAKVTTTGSTINLIGQGSKAVQADGINTLVTFKDSTLHVEGSSVLRGAEASNSAQIDFTNGTITAHGIQSNAIALAVDSQASISLEGTTVQASLSAGQSDAQGAVANNSGVLALASTDLQVNHTTATAAGISLYNDSELSASSGSVITSEGVNAYGVRAFDSTISVSHSTVNAEATTTARTIQGSDSHIDIEFSQLEAKGTDARTLTAQGSTVNMNAAIVSARDATQAMGIYGDQSALTLKQLNIDVNASNVATGLLASQSQLDLQESQIEVTSGGASTVGVASSDSDVRISDTSIAVKGEGTAWRSSNDTKVELVNSTASIRDGRRLTAVQLDGTSHAHIHGVNTLLEAHSSDDSGDVITLSIQNAGDTLLEHATLTAKASGNFSSAAGIYVSRGATLHVDAARIHAEATEGSAGALLIKDANSKTTVENSELRAIGQDNSHGIFVQNGASAQIMQSNLHVEHGEFTVGLNVFGNDSQLTFKQGTIKVRGDDVTAGMAIQNGATVHLEGTNMHVAGPGRTYILASEVGANSHLYSSGGSRLESTGAGFVMSGGTHVNLRDTEVITGDTGFEVYQFDTDLDSITLDAGSIATANNGTLLHVLRDTTTRTGRVNLNILNGAQVAGDIIDLADSAAVLTPDGGTFLTIDNAQYHGHVQNVRHIQLNNGAHISGGTHGTPNTVLDDIHIDPSSTLAGHWHVGGTLHASNGARIAPGNSIGTLTTAAINWGPGTLYEVEVNAKGESDSIHVSGPAAANIRHTALQVKPETGPTDYRLDHNYTILTAAGGIDGTFVSTEWQPNKLITVTPNYQANAVSIALSVSAQALDQAALSPNQRATAQGALSVAGANAAVDAAFLSADPAASLDLLSGEAHASTRAGLINNSHFLSTTILNRLTEHTAPTSSTRSDTLDDRHYPLWLSYAHSKAKTKGDNNTAEHRQDSDHLTIGAETKLKGDWNVGGAFAYSNSKFKVRERQSSSSIDSYGVALYAGKHWEHDDNTIQLKAGLGHTWHEVSTRRHLNLGGAQTLKSNYDAQTTQAFAELGYKLNVNESTTLEPYLGLNWLSHRSDAFKEKGGPAALQGRSGTDNTTFSTVGARATKQIQTDKSNWALQAGLAWRHALGDRQPGSTLSFIQGASNSFTVVGAPLAKNSAVLDLGAEVQMGTNTFIGLRYEGEAGNRATEHTGTLYLKTRF